MDNKCINTSDRFNIVGTFSRWIAFSGTLGKTKVE